MRTLTFVGAFCQGLRCTVAHVSHDVSVEGMDHVSVLVKPIVSKTGLRFTLNVRNLCTDNVGSIGMLR